MARVFTSARWGKKTNSFYLGTLIGKWVEIVWCSCTFQGLWRKLHTALLVTVKKPRPKTFYIANHCFYFVHLPTVCDCHRLVSCQWFFTTTRAGSLSFFPSGLEMQPSEKKMSIFEQKTRFDSSSLARHESVLKMERRNWIYYSNMSTQNHYGSANLAANILACFPLL